ncbi:pilus assembly protein PilM [candidate division KSB1 bacterium]|nr:pilus assembly protein PilM [candidate division KSB1 bacterium]
MALEQRRGLVGVSFLDNALYMVEVEVVGGQYQINKIARQTMELPFDVRQHNNLEATDRFSEHLNALAKANDIGFPGTSFSLDSQLVMVKKVPVDIGLSEIDMREQVTWEVEQFSRESEDKFNIDFSQLAIDRQRNSKELLIVAVRKAIIDLIVKIFSATNLKLRYVDVNIFAAFRAIQANYEIQKDEKIALVDISQNKVVLSLMKGSEFILSNEFTFQNDSNEQDGAFPTEEELSKLISKEIRRLILDHKLGENIEDLDRVFLFGEMVKDEVLETLQNFYDVRIDKANPFRRIRFSSNVKIDEVTWAKPETFVVSIGSALREI